MAQSIQTSRSLQWSDFAGMPKIVPKSVLYQKIQADSASSAGWSFHIRSPAPNSMLDNEVYIKYNIRITIDSDATDILFANGTARVSNDHLAALVGLRQCWAVARAYQNISLTINGVNITDQPYVWIDAMNRLFISEEEAETLCSLSGGEFDDGICHALSDCSNYKATVAADAALNTVIADGDYAASAFLADGANTAPGEIQVPVHRRLDINRGFSARVYRFIDKLRAQAANNAVVAADTVGAAHVGNGIIDVTVYERIPLSPFLFYDSKDIRQSIPNIRTMTLSVQYRTNQGQCVAQAQADPTSVVISSGSNGNAPELQMKWYLTETPLPQEVQIKAPICRIFRKQVDNLTVLTAATVGEPAAMDTNYTGINLEGVPDMMLIYARYKGTESYQYASEHFLTITALELTIGGASGKMNSISQGELYSMYLKNTKHAGRKKIPYEQWRKYNCVAALTPDDIGLDRGPGFNYPLQLAIKASLANNHVKKVHFAGIAAATEAAGNGRDIIYGDEEAEHWELCCIVYYDKFKLTLTASGGARLELLKA